MKIIRLRNTDFFPSIKHKSWKYHQYCKNKFLKKNYCQSKVNETATHTMLSALKLHSTFSLK
jgi:hypothetical protein